MKLMDCLSISVTFLCCKSRMHKMLLIDRAIWQLITCLTWSIQQRWFIVYGQYTMSSSTKLQIVQCCYYEKPAAYKSTVVVLMVYTYFAMRFMILAILLVLMFICCTLKYISADTYFCKDSYARVVVLYIFKHNL